MSSIDIPTAKLVLNAGEMLLLGDVDEAAYEVARHFTVSRLLGKVAGAAGRSAFASTGSVPIAVAAGTVVSKVVENAFNPIETGIRAAMGLPPRYGREEESFFKLPWGEPIYDLASVRRLEEFNRYEAEKQEARDKGMIFPDTIENWRAMNMGMGRPVLTSEGVVFKPREHIGHEIWDWRYAEWVPAYNKWSIDPANNIPPRKLTPAQEKPNDDALRKRLEDDAKKDMRELLPNGHGVDLSDGTLLASTKDMTPRVRAELERRGYKRIMWV